MNITDSDDFYLISGITGSIGEAIAVKLISRGCNVIGISRNKVNSTLKSKYPRISWFEYDLSEDDINNESIKKLQEIIGGKKLQAVYHCAGMHSKGKPLKLKQNEYIEPLKANLISSVNAVKLSIDLIKPGGKLFIQQFPNKYSFFEKINDFRGSSSHDIRLSKYELSLLTTFSSYKVTHVSYHQFLPYALNGFPKFIKNFYYKIPSIVRTVDKFFYKFPLTRLGSTSIQIICLKSTSCKS